MIHGMKDNTKIQLLAIDLDGTTLRNDASLSQNVKQALEHAIQQNIFVVPCTGRALGSLSSEITAISGITYAVTSNGAAIENLLLGKRIYCNLLDKETALSIMDILSSEDVMIEVFIQGKAYTEQRFLNHLTHYGTSEHYIPYVLSTRNSVDDIRSFIGQSPQNIENINLKTADCALRKRLWHELTLMQTVSITSSSSMNIEVSAVNTGKAQAVAHLCKVLGITMNEVMAIGDSLNDVMLLQQAGCSVAMENGVDEVKQAADFITLSNEADGVAYAIEHFLANRKMK